MGFGRSSDRGTARSTHAPTGRQDLPAQPGRFERTARLLRRLHRTSKVRRRQRTQLRSILWRERPAVSGNPHPVATEDQYPDFPASSRPGSANTVPAHDDDTATPFPAPPHWAASCTHQECTLHQLSPYIGKLKSVIARDLVLQYSRPGHLVVDMFKDPRGKSRRGQLVPRFYLRRYLIPHFDLTFSRRDSLQLENDDLNRFLLDPRKFEDRMRLKSKEDAERRREQRRKRAAKEEQAGLF